jgi:hypothetical protein
MVYAPQKDAVRDGLCAAMINKFARPQASESKNFYSHLFNSLPAVAHRIPLYAMGATGFYCLPGGRCGGRRRSSRALWTGRVM